MVGTGKYTEAQIRFIVLSKKSGLSNKEVVTNCLLRWPFGNFSASGVKYLVNKYQVNPLYNSGQLSAETFHPQMVQQYQAPGSGQMMHHQGPTMGQYHQGTRMVMGPHQSGGFGQQPSMRLTQNMMGAPQPYGPQTMMGAPQSHGAPQTMMPPQPVTAPQPMMAAPQGAAPKMSNDQLLAFAHSHMSPMQFLAFAQSLVRPDSGPATSHQSSQASSTPGMSSQCSYDGSAPEMQSNDSSPMASPQQTQDPSTPVMSEAQPFGFTAQLMSPEDSPQGMTYSQAMTTPPHGYTQGYTHGISGPQNWFQSQAVMPHQFQVPNQALMAHQQVAAPVVNQIVIPGHNLQPETAGSASQSTDKAGANLVKRAPYYGIVPPVKARFQSGQLGMLKNFATAAATRSPLAPISSPAHRVTKNTPQKMGAQPQLPISPTSSPKDTTGESPDAAVNEILSQEDQDFLLESLQAIIAEDDNNNMDVDAVTPENTTEVNDVAETTSATIEEADANDAPVENVSEAEFNAPVGLGVGTLFVGDNTATEAAAVVDVPAENHQIQQQGYESPISRSTRLFLEAEKARSPEELDSFENAEELFRNEWPSWITYEHHNAILGITPSAPVYAAPVSPIGPEMTIEEQYLYGLEQGIPESFKRGTPKNNLPN